MTDPSEFLRECHRRVGSPDQIIEDLRAALTAVRQREQRLLADAKREVEEAWRAVEAMKAGEPRVGRDRRSAQGVPPTQVPPKPAVSGREAGTG